MYSILIIDDSEVDIEFLKTLIEKVDSELFSVMTASNVIEAETLLGMSHFHFIFWNAKLDLIHYDSIETLLSFKNYKETTYVFYMASDETLILKPSLTHDQNRVIKKPFVEEDIVWKVKKLSALFAPIESVETEQLFSADDIQKQKDELIKQISFALKQELTNPLTSVLIGAQALSRRFDDGTPEKSIVNELEQCARRIRQSLDALGDMIDNPKIGQVEPSQVITRDVFHFNAKKTVDII